MAGNLRKSVHVYVFYSQKWDAVKIGSSNNYSVRLKTLSLSSPEPLRLLVAVPGNKDDEFTAHCYCSSSRIRGEWFSMSDRVTSLVAKMKRHKGVPPRLLKKYRTSKVDGGVKVWRDK